MKKLVRKAFVWCTIFTLAAFTLNVSASAACPLTSLFSLKQGNSLLSAGSSPGCSTGNSGTGNILSTLFGNSNIGNSSKNGNSQKSRGGNCNSGNILNGSLNKQGSCNIPAILQKYYINKNNSQNNNCPTGNCPSNNCPNGNCETEVCPNGNCETEVCPNGNCETEVCPNGNCETEACPNGNCETEACPNGNCETIGETYAEELLYYVNIARAENNLPRLTLNTKLNAAAEIRAKETVSNFSHTRPNGTSFSTVLKEVGITYNTCGENIAYGYQSAEKVFNGWMNSPGHKANILNGKFTYMGIGKYNNNWAQLFMS